MIIDQSAHPLALHRQHLAVDLEADHGGCHVAENALVIVDCIALVNDEPIAIGRALTDSHPLRSDGRAGGRESHGGHFRGGNLQRLPAAGKRDRCPTALHRIIVGRQRRPSTNSTHACGRAAKRRARRRSTRPPGPPRTSVDRCRFGGRLLRGQRNDRTARAAPINGLHPRHGGGALNRRPITTSTWTHRGTRLCLIDRHNLLNLIAYPI